MKLLILIAILIVGCQAKPTLDEIDLELAAESELYEADVETSDNFAGEPDTGFYQDESGDWIAVEDGHDIEDAPVTNPSGRFERLTKDCVVRATPRGERLHVLKAGRRLWVDEVDPGSGWFRVYTRNGLAFMSEVCFKNP